MMETSHTQESEWAFQQSDFELLPLDPDYMHQLQDRIHAALAGALSFVVRDVLQTGSQKLLNELPNEQEMQDMRRRLDTFYERAIVGGRHDIAGRGQHSDVGEAVHIRWQMDERPDVAPENSLTVAEIYLLYRQYSK